MTTNPTVVVYAKDDLRVEERAIPQPAADQALVDIEYGGICGSDLHYWLHGEVGVSVLRSPMVLGHEVVGTVRQQAADGTGPAIGTPVAVHPATPAPDGEIRWPADRPNLSPGCTYLGSAARHPHCDGAFTTVAALPSRMLRPLPVGLDLRTAALAEPAAVAWHAVRQAGQVAGRTVLVVGCGPIGLLVIAVLKRAGAARIVAVDLHTHALDRARAVGATEALSADRTTEISAVQADVTIEASGHPAGLASAITSTVRGGRLVMLGLLPPGPQPVPIATAIARELELVGSFRFNDEIDEVVAAMADGSLVVEPVVTHEFPVTDTLTAFETAKDASLSSKVLLRF